MRVWFVPWRRRRSTRTASWRMTRSPCAESAWSVFTVSLRTRSIAALTRNGDTHWDKRLEALDFRWNGVSGTLQLREDRYIKEDFTFDKFAFNFGFLNGPLRLSSYAIWSSTLGTELVELPHLADSDLGQGLGFLPG
jgi:hypothetical protein